MAIRNQTTQHKDKEIRNTTMARVLDLRDILELTNNTLDDRSLVEQDAVGHGHQLVFHVHAQFANQLEIEPLKQRFS